MTEKVKRLSISNFNQAEMIIDVLKDYYTRNILEKAHKNGGMESLAEHLGYSKKYMYQVVHRQSFDSLRAINYIMNEKGI